MSKNYKVIKNGEQVTDFIKNFLPDLEDNEKFYCALFVRKKYAPELVHSNDKTQLKRFLSDKDRLFHKLWQLETELGSYFLKDKVAPQEALVAYINPNPRNTWRATFDGLIHFGKMLRDGAKNFNPVQEMMSCVQRSCSRKIWLDFDIDDPKAKFDALDTIINLEAVRLLQTRGGYHLLVNLKEIDDRFKNSFYNNIRACFEIDQVGDQLIPIPGCVQGGFVPKFIDL